MAHIKKLNPKTLSDHTDFKNDPITMPLSVDAEVLKFIKNPERNQELSLEGIVDALFESGLHEKRYEIERTVLELKDKGYISQNGNHTFKVTESGEDYLTNGKKVAEKSKKIAPKADLNLNDKTVLKNKKRHEKEHI